MGQTSLAGSWELSYRARYFLSGTSGQGLSCYNAQLQLAAFAALQLTASYLGTVLATWEDTGRMFEKFNVETLGVPGGMVDVWGRFQRRPLGFAAGQESMTLVVVPCIGCRIPPGWS